jgi:hypothetical protein
VQDVALHGPLCRPAGADVLQFRFLQVPRDGDAALAVGPEALLQTRGVELATMPQGLSQQPLLLGCWCAMRRAMRLGAPANVLHVTASLVAVRVGVRR